MKSAKHGRLAAPAIMIIGGTGLAGAVVVGQGWEAAVPAEAVAVVAAIGYYIWGGRDSDMGAMFGSRVDERQSLLRMRAQSLGGAAGGAAALIGYMVAVALKDPVWPFVLVLGVGAAAFIAGLAIYGARPLGNHAAGTGSRHHLRRGSPVAARQRRLTKRFGTTRALDGIDLSIPEGTVFGLLGLLGLLGPNGAGKPVTEL